MPQTTVRSSQERLDGSIAHQERADSRWGAIYPVGIRNGRRVGGGGPWYSEDFGGIFHLLL